MNNIDNKIYSMSVIVLKLLYIFIQCYYVFMIDIIYVDKPWNRGKSSSAGARRKIPVNITSKVFTYYD